LRKSANDIAKSAPVYRRTAGLSPSMERDRWPTCELRLRVAGAEVILEPKEGLRPSSLRRGLCAGRYPMVLQNHRLHCGRTHNPPQSSLQRHACCGHPSGIGRKPQNPSIRRPRQGLLPAARQIEDLRDYPETSAIRPELAFWPENSGPVDQQMPTRHVSVHQPAPTLYLPLSDPKCR
jgi:hypothetical protein